MPVFSLVSRKSEWQRQEAERIASIPDPDMPPGHKLMPTQEKRETLEKLKRSKDEMDI